MWKVIVRMECLNPTLQIKSALLRLFSMCQISLMIQTQRICNLSHRHILANYQYLAHRLIKLLRGLDGNAHYPRLVRPPCEKLLLASMPYIGNTPNLLFCTQLFSSSPGCRLVSTEYTILLSLPTTRFTASTSRLPSVSRSMG
jgi:hypothetical protein